MAPTCNPPSPNAGVAKLARPRKYFSRSEPRPRCVIRSNCSNKTDGTTMA